MIITLIYGFICLISGSVSWDWFVAWVCLLIDYIFK